MQYAKSKGLNVVKVYSESVTASKAGRVEFNKMLDFAKKQRYGCHVIIEKNDRTLRNEDDEALLINLAVRQGVIDLHLPKDHLILNKDSTPHEIFMFHLLCGMSCMYPRNLSREIKKGLDKQVLFYISKIHNPIFFWHLIFEPKNRYNNFAILVLLLS